MKRCSKCKEYKDYTEFSKHAKEPDGHYCQCKKCAAASNRSKYEENRERYIKYAEDYRKRNPEKARESARRTRKPEKERNYRLLKTYGITSEDYNRMYQEQGGKCAICGLTSEVNFHIDHDHDTGKVRGLLCNRCNKALGFVDDNPTILERMIRYINGHRHH